MKTEQIIETLQDYNDWRRAKGKWNTGNIKEIESFFDTTTALEIGLTIDATIERLQALEKERDEAREEAVEFRDYYEGEPDSLDDLFPWEKEREKTRAD